MEISYWKTTADWNYNIGLVGQFSSWEYDKIALG
jgi:hypothetical protein